jgi:DnaJ like chaperone protein
MSFERIAETIGLGPGGAVRTAVLGLMSRLRKRRPPYESAAFTSAFVALAAKMAAADGVAVRAEAEAFERLVQTPAGDAENVRRLYNLAKQDTAGYELYAERIGNLLREEPDLKRMVLDCLLAIACSDGVLHPAEDKFLATVAAKFGLAQDEYRAVRALFVRDAESPHAILGVAPDASDAAIKARYRELVRGLHPDRLAATGAPPAVVKAATAKLATINAAYDTILGQRRRGGGM